jgi:hypothetical protein
VGSKGGFARAGTLTPEERWASAKKAAKARWAKAKKKAAKKTNPEYGTDFPSVLGARED